MGVMSSGIRSRQSRVLSVVRINLMVKYLKTKQETRGLLAVNLTASM